MVSSTTLSALNAYQNQLGLMQEASDSTSGSAATGANRFIILREHGRPMRSKTPATACTTPKRSR